MSWVLFPGQTNLVQIWDLIKKGLELRLGREALGALVENILNMWSWALALVVSC